MLTKKRCDECITIRAPRLCPITLETLPAEICWDNNKVVLGKYRFATPDEAELFAYRLLDAVKRAREQYAE